MSAAGPRRWNRSAGLGLAGVSRAEAAASFARAEGQAPPPELAGVRMRPRPRERALAAAWGERHRMLALARLHRMMAAELDDGRWPQPIGLDLQRFGRVEFVALLTRLRDGVLPDGTPGPISPVFAQLDPEAEAAGVEIDAAAA